MVQLSSARRLHIVYIKQPLLFYRSINLKAPFSHRLHQATFVVFIDKLSSTRRLDIVYIKQPLLFLWINYPHRAV